MTDKAMARTTGIEWTQHTWNPQVGCSVLSAGCTNCYAMRQAYRLEHAFRFATYQGTTRKVNGKPVWTGKVNLSAPSQLRKPETIREPALIFVNSMTDAFHPDAPDSNRDIAFDIMLAVRRHTYQVLTKRPDVAVRYYATRTDIHHAPHIWIGTSVESANVVDRIDTLRRVPAAVRFLSVEPLIGPLGTIDLTGIHWVIVGGESGPGARPMHPDWVREVRDQCVAQGVACYFKQWGRYTNNPLMRDHGMTAEEAEAEDPHGKGGSRLDGREWRQMPAQYEAAAALI